MRTKKKFTNQKNQNLKHGDPEVHKIVYDVLKDIGICTRCRAQWAEKGYVCCHMCILYWRNRTKFKNQIDRYKTKIVTMKAKRKVMQNAS